MVAGLVAMPPAPSIERGSVKFVALRETSWFKHCNPLHSPGFKRDQAQRCLQRGGEVW